MAQGVPEDISSWIYQLSMSPPTYEYMAQDESQYLMRGRPVTIRDGAVNLADSVTFKTQTTTQRGYNVNRMGQEMPETKNVR